MSDIARDLGVNRNRRREQRMRRHTGHIALYHANAVGYRGLRGRRVHVQEIDQSPSSRMIRLIDDGCGKDHHELRHAALHFRVMHGCADRDS